MTIRRFLLLFTAMVLATACRSPSPPRAPTALRAPDWLREQQRHLGSPLSGPRLEDGKRDLTPGAHVRLRWLLVRPPLPRDWEPLPSRARVIAESRGDIPWRTGSLRADSLRVATGDRASAFLSALEQEPDRFLAVEDLGLDVVPGTTAMLKATRSELVVAPGDFFHEMVVRGPVQRHFAVQLHQPDKDASVQLALSWTDTDDLRRIRRERGAPDLVPVDPTELRHELFLLRDTLTVDSGPLVILGPVPFEEPTGGLLAVVAEALPLPEFTADRRQFLEEAFSASLARLREELGPSGRQEVVNLRRSSAWAALRTAEERRSALVFLAGDLDMALTADVALSASDEFLAGFSARLLEDPAIQEASGWALERHAWKELAAFLVTHEDNLGLQGMALRHAGQIGRFPDVLRGLLTISVDLEDFHRRLRLENRSFLEDSDPGARVRAHDWLSRQGEAVEGYDPLADAASRRAALKGSP